VYEELGFKVLEIPRIPVASRADFVLSSIGFDEEAD
jgi:predicted ATPase